MDIDSINEAFAAGHIDDQLRRHLVDCLERAHTTCGSGSPVHALLQRIEISAPVESPLEDPRDADPLPFPGGNHRPGLTHVFQQLHAGALRHVSHDVDFQVADPKLQLMSLMRFHTQAPLAAAIRQIWPPMKDWLERGFALIPKNQNELKSPAAAESDTWHGIPVIRLPLDERLADLFGAGSSDQLLALLRRIIERMGRMFVDDFLSSPAARSQVYVEANEVLSVLRGLNMRAVLCNGFTSGAADVINPLHCLVEHVVRTGDTDVNQGDWRQAVLAEHLNFVIGLATFSLDCLAEIEHLLRQPASPETIRFTRKWSNIRPNFRGKGCPFDCNYDEAYFVVRHVLGKQGRDVPVIDFQPDRFTSNDLQRLRSRMLRLGCPSLGMVHQEFSQLMGAVYFSAIVPHLGGRQMRIYPPTTLGKRQTLGGRHISTPSEESASDLPIENLTPSHETSETASYREVRYEYTPVLCDILKHLRCSIVVTTYQAGKLLVLGVQDDGMQISFLDFDQPMGIAVGKDRIAVGTRRQIHFLKGAHEMAPSITPEGMYDGCFLPRTSFYTGAIQGHDLAFGTDELWVVNTLFSCLCTLHDAYSFVPQWRPPFVSQLVDQDRCHLNGLAMENGKPRYVTVLGASDEPAGWRPNKVNGGCVLDVKTGETIARGLSMPHSPRLRGEQLWVLNSGHGSLGTVDVSTGKFETVETMPGYTRGLSLAGQFAFVGLSKIRETAIFGGVPIAEDHAGLRCGIGVVDLLTGQTVAVFQFLSGVEEIFAVDVIPEIRSPFLSGSSVGEQQRDVWIVPLPPGEKP